MTADHSGEKRYVAPLSWHDTLLSDTPSRLRTRTIAPAAGSLRGIDVLSPRKSTRIMVQVVARYRCGTLGATLSVLISYVLRLSARQVLDDCALRD